MKIIKELVFICLVSSLRARRILSSNYRHPWQQTQRSHHMVNMEPESCFCPVRKPHSVFVPDIIDSNHADLERVVVYLYKDKITNDIIMYTPNKERQRLIPEFPFETGDGLLKIGTETVIHMFETNLNVIVIPNTKTALSDFSLRPIDVSVTEGLPIGINSGKIHYANTHLPSHANLGPWGLEQYKPGSTNAMFYSHQQSVHSTPSMASPKPEIVQTYNEQFDPWQLRIIPGKLKSTPNYGQYNLKYFEEEKAVPDSSNTEINFEEWFNLQLKQLLPELMQNNDPDMIDIYSLKEQIIKALRDNSLIISGKYITDATGRSISMSDLKLHRIVIEEKLVKNTNNYSQKPRLDGIMITFNHPPKILGIVALRKTYPEHVITVHRSISPKKKPDLIAVHDSIKEGRVAGPNSASSHLQTTQSFKVPPIIIGPRLTSQENLISAINEPHKDDDTGRIFTEVKNMVQSLGTVVNSNIFDTILNYLSEENEIPEEISSTPGSSPTLVPETADSDEVPGVRIIGGKPATSSGTPLNSKGRSGILDGILG